MRFPSASILIIGRGEACDFRPKSPKVSRKHAVIFLSTSGEVLLRDLGSENGTWVNDVRIEETRVLKAGDKVTLGPVELTWIVEGDNTVLALEAQL